MSKQMTDSHMFKKEFWLLHEKLFTGGANMEADSSRDIGVIYARIHINNPQE